MKCINCGSEVGNYSFCNNCGASILSNEGMNYNNGNINVINNIPDKITDISNKLAIASIFVLCFLSVVSIFFSVAAIVTGIKSYKQNMKVNIGLIVGIFITILDVCIIIYFITLINDLAYAMR